MKRARPIALLFTAAVFIVASPAQEPARANETALQHASEPPAEGEQGNLELWRWANFVVLAGGL